ncbi:MAG: hypothetical protein V4654_09105 [Bdellovibrionota bacterium]
MKKLLMFAFLAFGLNVAFAGQDTGGGAGIFCPASVTTQPRVQLLDLYEGRIKAELQILETNIPYQEQLEAILSKLSFDFSMQFEIRKALAEIEANHRFLPSGVGIHVPPDLGEGEAVLMPTGCVLGAIGYYEDGGVLKISRDAFELLSETQKTAFWLHEAFYKAERNIKTRSTESQDLYLLKFTSKNTRKFIAQLFSTEANLRKLYDLGRFTTHRSIEYFSKITTGTKDFTVATGQEGSFDAFLIADLILGKELPYVLPIQLPKNMNRRITLEVRKHPDYEDINMNVKCYKLVGGGFIQSEAPNLLNEQVQNENGMTIYQGDLPENCEALNFYAWYATDINFKYNNQTIFTTKIDSSFISPHNPPSGELTLPLYWR